MESAKKKKEDNSKKNKYVGKHLNKEFYRTFIRYKKQYYNIICKDVEDGKTRKKISEFRKCLAFQFKIGI